MKIKIYLTKEERQNLLIEGYAYETEERKLKLLAVSTDWLMLRDLEFIEMKGGLS